MKPADVFKSVSKNVLLTMGGATLLLILIIAGILILRDYMEDQSINAIEQRRMAYDTSRLSQTNRMKNRSELLYPEVIEELDLSMDPYRSPDFEWTEQEVSRLWIEPDASDIDYFTDANHRLIWDILKDAP